jgi:hypothetical protein
MSTAEESGVGFIGLGWPGHKHTKYGFVNELCFHCQRTKLC